MQEIVWRSIMECSLVLLTETMMVIPTITVHTSGVADSCHKSNLNGEYGNTDNSNGINWYHWKGFTYSMKEVRMMVLKPLP